MTSAALISLLIALVIFGVVLYLLTLIPLDATVAKIIRVIAILFIVLYAISVVVGTQGFHLLK